MFLLWRRYSRSGAAPPWFYVGLAIAFAALVAWAVVERDWLVAAIAAVLVVLSTLALRAAKLIARAAAESDARRERDA